MVENEYEIQQEMVDSIFKNSIRFLNISIDEITTQDLSNINNVTKLVILMQTTIELSMKYSLAYNEGNLDICKITKEKNLKKACKEFKEGTLITKAYGNLKKDIEKLKILTCNKVKIKELIEKFQSIRNKLVHFSYIFDETEIEKMAKECIYIIFNIIFPLLYTKYSIESLDFLLPSEFLKIYCGKDRFNKIKDMSEYKEVVTNILNDISLENNLEVVKCVYCEKKSWIKDIQRCFLCDEITSENAILLKCNICNAERTVLYSESEFEDNNNCVRATCLNCGAMLSVAKCKKCGRNTVYYEEYFDEVCAGFENANCKIECEKIEKSKRMPYSYAYIIPAIILARYINENKVEVKNENKNIIKIFANKCLSNYILSNDIDEAIKVGLEYLKEKNYCLFLFEVTNFINRTKQFIEKNYKDGCLNEEYNLCKLLFRLKHPNGIAEKFYEIYKRVINEWFYNGLDITGTLSNEERDIIYECRENLDIESRLYFKLYENRGLIKPTELK